MESMPPTRRKKINGAEQTSASHAKGPAVTMMIDRSSPSLGKNLHGGRQVGVADLAAGFDDFARKLDGGVPLRVAGMAVASENDVIGRQLGHMLGRKAVNRQAIVAAIHFGDSEADAVTRLHVEHLAQGAEQGGPRVERDRSARRSPAYLQ